MGSYMVVLYGMHMKLVAGEMKWFCVNMKEWNKIQIQGSQTFNSILWKPGENKIEILYYKTSN